MQLESQENSYKSIFKGTAIFGGTQFFQILINLVRGKFIAILLGTVGMGINSLFYSAVMPIQQLAVFGMNLPLVKEISSAENEEKRLRIISICRRLFIWAALIGAGICILASPLLSYSSFGNLNSLWGFIALSLMVLFGVLGTSELTIMQGTRQIKRISISTLIGSLVGLFICVPLYYFFGYNAIVPSLIIVSLSTYLFFFFSSDIRRTGVHVKLSDNKPFVKRILFTGGIFLIGSVVGSLCNYFINIFVRESGSLADVGLYQAANSITNQYSMLVFASLAADYLPRLSKSVDNNGRMKGIINRQTSVILLLICPIACLVIALAPWVIKVLLSAEFEVALPLIKLFAIAVILKTACFPLGYITFVKDNRRVFFILEVLTGNVLYVLLTCIFYYFYGLNGLGYGMILLYAVMFIIYSIVNFKLYGIISSRRNLGYIIVGCAIILVVFWLSLNSSLSSTVTMGSLCVITLLLSLKQLTNLLRS